MTTNERRTLDELTKEDYVEVLEAIQAALSECAGVLIILEGYLDSDHSLDLENAPYVLMAAKDIVRVACRSVKSALSHTYPII